MSSNTDVPCILAVDDDPLLTMHVVSSLKKSYHVIAFHSAKDALVFVQNNDVDLIILDVCMPEMSGLELNEILQKDEKTKNIPVIFLTGIEDDETVSAIIQSGANDYLPKPIAPADLLLHVRNQLTLHAAERHAK